MTRCRRPPQNLLYHRLVTALALAALALGAPGCPRRDKDKQDDRAAPVPIQVLEVAPASITRVLEYDADVKGLLEVNVFSQVPERIVAMKVKEGDPVRKGELMAQVRADLLAASVSSASAALDASRADREYLKSELARQSQLLQRKIVSAATVDQLRSRLASSDAQIRRMEAMTSQASTARGNAVIRAPIDGVVGRCNLGQGDLALPTLPICTVVQMDQVELVLDVPERDLALIREKMVARVAVARFPKQPFEGQVVRILPTIDRRTRTAQVKVQLDNKGHKLMPGMLARVSLEVERHDRVVVVPYSSLIIEMGARGEVSHRTYVVLNSGEGPGKVQERIVTLGIVDGPRVEITSGLSPGDRMVTRGQHLLEPGRAVAVVERLSARGDVIKVASPDGEGADKSGKPEKSDKGGKGGSGASAKGGKPGAGS